MNRYSHKTIEVKGQIHEIFAKYSALVPWEVPLGAIRGITGWGGVAQGKIHHFQKA